MERLKNAVDGEHLFFRDGRAYRYDKNNSAEVSVPSPMKGSAAVLASDFFAVHKAGLRWRVGENVLEFSGGPSGTIAFSERAEVKIVPPSQKVATCSRVPFANVLAEPGSRTIISKTGIMSFCDWQLTAVFSGTSLSKKSVAVSPSAFKAIAKLDGKTTLLENGVKIVGEDGLVAHFSKVESTPHVAEALQMLSELPGLKAFKIEEKLPRIAADARVEMSKDNVRLVSKSMAVDIPVANSIDFSTSFKAFSYAYNSAIGPVKIGMMPKGNAIVFVSESEDIIRVDLITRGGGGVGD